MISDGNILRFLYFLFFIFFLSKHLLIIFPLVSKIKRKDFFGRPCCSPLYKKELFLRILLFSEPCI